MTGGHNGVTFSSICLCSTLGSCNRGVEEMKWVLCVMAMNKSVIGAQGWLQTLCRGWNQSVTEMVRDRISHLRVAVRITNFAAHAGSRAAWRTLLLWLATWKSPINLRSGPYSASGISSSIPSSTETVASTTGMSYRSNLAETSSPLLFIQRCQNKVTGDQRH